LELDKFTTSVGGVVPLNWPLKMTENLKTAIQNLYKTFSAYTLNRGMPGCPCCVNEARQEVLYSKPLKQLSGQELSHYYLKAMTTWGGVNDFKHFLPRFFEILATDKETLQVFIIFEHLDYANWDTWNLDEREPIKSFLIAWWEDSTLSEFYFNGEEFLYFGSAIGSFQPLLDNWNISIDNPTFKNLIHFIFGEFQQYKIGKGIDEEAFYLLRNWLAGHASIIEKGFYYYEKSDPAFAQTISFCYDIVTKMY